MNCIFKKLTVLSSTLIVVISSSIYSCSNKTMATGENPRIVMAIDSSNWTFTPSQVLPQSGRSQQVNGSTYSATLKDGKLQVYLPYYGRAYGGADILSGRSPLDFTSIDFGMNKEKKANGRWNIKLLPRDDNNVQSMNFIFFDNSSAKLDVVLTNRSGISFNGVVGPLNQ